MHVQWVDMLKVKNCDLPWLLTSHLPSYFVDLWCINIIGQTWLVIHYSPLGSKQ